MIFSPAFLASRFVEPLRYFFSTYSGDSLKYNKDPKLSTMDIGSINDFHKVQIQEKPRVLISRGGYNINPSGLTDSLAEAKSALETGGLTDRINLITLSGAVQILIQARQEGTCEIITDMVQHFIVWTTPYLCNTQGFKSIGMPAVSPCTPDKEDTEIFSVSISIPWVMEESWRIQNDALKLKEFFLTMNKPV